MKRFVTVAVLTLLLAVTLQPVGAKPRKPPLPSLPPQGVIDSVIAQTGGAVFTPLDVSTDVQNSLNSFGGDFSGVALDTGRAVHYITTGRDLLETLVPVSGIENALLAPAMTTPGASPKPGLVIGAWFQPPADARWVVLTFKGNGDPDRIRFYRANNTFTEADLVKGTFVDVHNDGQIEDVDAGAVLSHKRSCITVGLQQVCWAPVKPDQIRDETKPEKKAKKAEDKFKKLYDFSVTFDSKNAVPDLLGKAQREACAAQLSSATSYVDMDGCKANLIIATAKVNGKKKKNAPPPSPDAPIALLVLSADADVRAYDTNGNAVGALPADKYLVIPTPTSSADAGTPTALFLVGLSGQNYLVPSTIMQGFGAGAIGDTGQAGIRDGFVRYRLFGW